MANYITTLEKFGLWFLLVYIKQLQKKVAKILSNSKIIMKSRTEKKYKSFGVTGSHDTEADEKQCRDFHTNVNKWKTQEDEY